MAALKDPAIIGDRNWFEDLAINDKRQVRATNAAKPQNTLSINVCGENGVFAAVQIPAILGMWEIFDPTNHGFEVEVTLSRDNVTVNIDSEEDDLLLDLSGATEGHSRYSLKSKIAEKMIAGWQKVTSS